MWARQEGTLIFNVGLPLWRKKKKKFFFFFFFFFGGGRGGGHLTLNV